MPSSYTSSFIEPEDVEGAHTSYRGAYDINDLDDDYDDLPTPRPSDYATNPIDEAIWDENPMAMFQPQPTMREVGRNGPNNEQTPLLHHRSRASLRRRSSTTLLSPRQPGRSTFRQTVSHVGVFYLIDVAYY
jgi:hypothetical protein